MARQYLRLRFGLIYGLASYRDPAQNSRMQFSPTRYLSLQTALVLYMVSALLWGAEEPPAYEVLILNSFDSKTSPYMQPAQIFRTEIQRRLSTHVSFHEVNLEANWGVSPERESLIENLVRDIYGNSKPDLVLAIGPPGVKFWLAHRDHMFTATPSVVAAGEGRFGRSDLRPGDASILTVLSFKDFVDSILSLMPETTHFLMIFGGSEYERALARFAEVQLEGLKGRVRFEYSNDMTLAVLQERLASLGDTSVVFYGMFNYDAADISLGFGEGIDLVTKASAVPVFGAMGDQLGKGIVGGRLIDLDRMGKRMAAVAEKILLDPSSEIQWERIDLTPPAYDWRELEAWGIDIDRLPANSEIRFKSPTFWDEYSGWILSALLILLVQSVLIGALLLERRNRLIAERARAKLSGGLITSHEDERRRIARELHDDLSQRLAGLAIDTATLPPFDQAEEHANSINRLQTKITGLSKDMHDMSYRLHPSTLDDLGITAALKSEIQHLESQTPARLIDWVDELEVQIPPDTALCVFRIAQESLHNAVKYAGADRIEVDLEQVNGNLTLTVSDNGCGFSMSEDRYKKGLGLFSMQERANLVGGILHISSQPERGTTITATLPTGPRKQDHEST